MGDAGWGMGWRIYIWGGDFERGRMGEIVFCLYKVNEYGAYVKETTTPPK